MPILLRGKGKYNTDVTMHDAYRFYRKSYKRLDESLYCTIIKEFCAEVMHHIIYKNFIFKFPHRLGQLLILKTKLKPKLDKEGNLINVGIDYAKSWELWREMHPDKSDQEIAGIKGKPIVYHDNKHSDYYSPKFYWDKRTCTAKNQGVYSFRASRSHKRTVASIFKQQTDIDYHEQA